MQPPLVSQSAKPSGRSDGEIANGRRIAFGTDDGVYLSDLREPNRDPIKVLALLDVSQVDVLEEYQLLIVLSGKFLSALMFITHEHFFRATSDYFSLGRP